MTNDDYLAEFHRLPAFTFPGPGEAADLPAPDAVAWRITGDVDDMDEPWEAAFDRFRAEVDTTRVRALVVGAWPYAYQTDSSGVIAALLAARDRLPALRALFLGDILAEECEISWINQADVTPLLTGFPELEEFGVRGGMGLALTPVRHEALRTLTVQTGGLPADVVRAVAASDLPQLVHLDLWLGVATYGGDSEVADLEPVLSGARLPRLRYLALRNSDMQDAVAAAVATAAVVAQLEVLDLSMGTLTDKGATALLDGGPLTHLKKLDLHHHFLSEALKERIRESLEPAGVEVDLDEDDADSYEEEDGTVHRYVSVDE